MLVEASATTRDAACGHKGRRPFGLRRRRAFSTLRLLDNAIHCIACVAAPRKRLGGVITRPRAGFIRRSQVFYMLLGVVGVMSR